MNKKQNFLGILFSAIILILLCLPAIQFFFHPIPEKRLYGFVEKKSNKPDEILTGWFNKKLQQYLADLFDNGAGFRTFCVRGFNELSFRLFSEVPRFELYSTKEYGLYSKMSIDQLNAEYANRKNLSKAYEQFSKKIIELQQILELNGKHFVVIISSSKPYVHPDGLNKKLLTNPNKEPFAHMASLGYELKKAGVNVIDSGPILREFYKNNTIETHPYSGVHWNYYAGCVIAQYLLNDAKRTFSDIPVLNCGNPIYKKPEMVDVDGLLILNVFTDVNLIKPSPYPNPTVSSKVNFLPKMLLVGDSFMDQIIYTLDESKAYSDLVLSSYFRTRLTHQPGQSMSWDNPQSLTTEQIQSSILEDALTSDIIILQMVDYNIPRYGYGFSDALLQHINEKQSKAVEISIKEALHDHNRETDGNNWWYWVKNKITFSLNPSFMPYKSNKTKLHFEYGSRRKQQLTIKILSKNGKITKIDRNSDKNENLIIDTIINESPDALREISFETDGIAYPLSAQDNRMAAWIIRNLKIAAIP